MIVVPQKFKEKYLRLWGTCQITAVRFYETEWFSKKVIQNKERYEVVQSKLGLPWYIVGFIHGKECAFDFKRGVHNGDFWDLATVKEPKGRGPFNSWEESAIDAMDLQLKKHRPSEQLWTIDKFMYFCDFYDGIRFGDRINSPYLFCATNHFNGGDMSSKIGLCAFLKYLESHGIVELPVPVIETPTEIAPASSQIEVIKASLFSRFIKSVKKLIERYWKR